MTIVAAEEGVSGGVVSDFDGRGVEFKDRARLELGDDVTEHEEFVEGIGVIEVGPGGFAAAAGLEPIGFVAEGGIDFFWAVDLEIFELTDREEADGSVVFGRADAAFGAEDDGAAVIDPFFVFFVTPI